VDPYRYLPFLTRKVMQAWVAREQPPARVSWTPLHRPLAACRVALLASAGIALRSDRPFDQQGERDDPWWGDPSWRALPADVTEGDVRLYHLHIDPGPAEQDLDVELPVRRLRELVEAGVVGEVSPRHFSIMGYILDATDLVTRTAPQLADAMVADDVDLALLVPS
jgi:D-proline reductase (dithiol) PrdB